MSRYKNTTNSTHALYISLQLFWTVTMFFLSLPTSVCVAQKWVKIVEAMYAVVFSVLVACVAVLGEL